MASNISAISSMSDTGTALLSISALSGWTINYKGGSINKTFTLGSSETFRIVPVEVGYTYIITYTNGTNSVTSAIEITRVDKFYTASLMDFTYTGNYNYRSDGVLELLTSGTLTFINDYVLDFFCVGGGASGSPFLYYSNMTYYGQGGGGGYTTTKKNNIIEKNKSLTITIGAGGISETTYGRAGENTIVSYNGDTLCYANGAPKAPSMSTDTDADQGRAGDGGSGGAGAPWYKSDGSVGGSDGGNGEKGKGTRTYGGGVVKYGADGGNGQGTTTREFGESTGKLYAGGGGSPGVPQTGYTGGAGGEGGGGAGGTYAYSSSSTDSIGKNGTANTGGGGGGSTAYGSSWKHVAGGSGGSGIVCVRLYTGAQ